MKDDTGNNNTEYVDPTKNAFRPENMYEPNNKEKEKEEGGRWMSTTCINWHHLDCRVERCECVCHNMSDNVDTKRGNS